MADKQNEKKDNPLPQRAGAPGRGGRGGGGRFNNDNRGNQGGPQAGNQGTPQGRNQGTAQGQRGGSNQNQQKPQDRNGTGGPPDHQENHNSSRGGPGGRGGRGGGYGGGQGGYGNQGGHGGADHQDDNNGPHRGGPGGRGGRGGGPGGRGGFRGGQRPDGGRGGQGGDDRMGGGGERYFTEKIMAIQGPTLDLPPSEEKKDIKYANNCRLYIGNVGGDITDLDIEELFKKYGETQELFMNKEKMFGFIRMDYKHNADKAKAELDGHTLKGRTLKIRYAPINAGIKVKNLTSCVTNELLELAFSVFGDIERAIVIVDERGNSKCEGIVEFSRKPAAAQAIRRCAEGCFFLTQSLRPVIVEPLELTDDVDGLTEKSINRKNQEFYKQRQVGPRFATVNSFEFEYGSRWKQLHELFKQKEESLQRELKMEEEKLEAQMEYARYEHETEMLRKELASREADRERQKSEWEMKERKVEEFKRRDEEMMKKHAEEMQLRMAQQGEDMRRRQTENSAFLAEQHGGAFNSPGQGFGGGGGDGNAAIDFEALAAAVGNVTGGGERGGGFDQVGRGGGRGRQDSNSGWSRRESGSRWGNPGGQEIAGARRVGVGNSGPSDFQNKRRRF